MLSGSGVYIPPNGSVVLDNRELAYAVASDFNNATSSGYKIEVKEVADEEVVEE